MARRKAANLLKGAAWLLLGAAVLPTFSTSDGPSGAATKLTVGLPWSPWLAYRESWSRPDSMHAVPELEYATTIKPRSWSTAVLAAGAALVGLARMFNAPQKSPPRAASATFARANALSASPGR